LGVYSTLTIRSDTRPWGQI